MPIGLTLLTGDPQTDAELVPFLKKQGYNLLSLEITHKSLPPGCLDADLIIYEVQEDDHNSLVHLYNLITDHGKPVIVVSRELPDLMRAELYRMGVQDIILAPWYPNVLDVRIRTALQRAGFRDSKNRVIQWQMGQDQLVLHADRHAAFVNGDELKLTFSQWNILSTLVGNGGVALSRNYLLRECLHFEQGDTRTLDNHIKNLRKVLGDSAHIETLHGYGYKLNGQQIKDMRE